MTSNEGAGSTATHTKGQIEEFDFRFPHLNVIRATDTSNTKEALLEALFGNVTFQEWKDFDELLTKTVDETKYIPEKFRKRAFRHFENCANEVNLVSECCEQNPIKPTLEREPRASEVCHEVTPLYEHDDPRQLYDTSSSIAVFEDIFRGMRELLNGLHSPKCSFQLNSRKYCLIGIPSVYKLRSPIPDKALCTMSMNRPMVPPVCTFEMKGPAVRITPYVLDYCKMIGNAASGSTKSQAGEQNIKCKHEVSGKKLCLYLKHLFQAEPVINSNLSSESSVNKGMARKIGQTLIQGLTSSTGCCFLYTYETGIAFEVMGLNDNKLNVRASSVYCCGHQKGAAAALLTLANHAVKKIDADKESFDRIAQCVKHVIERSKPDTNRGGRKNARRTKNKDSSEEQRHSSTGNGSTRTGDNFDSVTKESPMRELKVEENAAKDLISEESEMSDVTEETAFNDYEDMLIDIVKSQTYVLATGASGSIVCSAWKGKKVALKVWNGESEAGLDDLRREIEIYKHIHSYAFSLLGDALANLVLAVDTTRRDGTRSGKVALGTEYVEAGLYRDMNGQLWIEEGANHCSISNDDQRDICDAALRSLQLLHQNDILHGDIALRNLRVKRLLTSRDYVIGTWKVSWIDLGHAQIGHPFFETQSKLEEEICLSLFK